MSPLSYARYGRASQDIAVESGYYTYGQRITNQAMMAHGRRRRS
ncbi:MULTISPECIES: hypothetical protein [Vibrio]|nr:MULTISPECIES: hypothetical protein [Vibrio]